MEPTQSVFSHVLLRACEPDEAGLALLTWRAAGAKGRAAQVYVNERLYDVVADAASGSCWLRLDRTLDARVELLAVDPAAAWVERPKLLASWSPRLRTAAELTIVRDEALPIDSRVVVSVDGVDEPEVPLWTGGDGRAGFGGLHGIGGFGFDDATGPGAGLGDFGVGGFGFDGHAWRWRRDDLPGGEHELAATIRDAAGRTVAELPAPRHASIDTLPRPATQVTIDNDWTLRWA